MSIIDDFINSISDSDRKQAMAEVCRIALDHIPNPTDGVSYNLPAYFYRNKPVIGFANNKNFMSVYPFSGKVVEKMREDLTNFEHTPGSIHFTSDKPLTEAVINKLIELRLHEIRA